MLQIVTMEQISSLISFEPHPDQDLVPYTQCDRVFPTNLVRRRWFSVSLKDLKIHQVEVNGMNYVMSISKAMVCKPPYFDITQIHRRDSVRGIKLLSIDGPSDF